MLIFLQLCFFEDTDIMFNEWINFSENMVLLKDNENALKELEENLKIAKASKIASISLIDSLVESFKKAVPYEEIFEEIEQWEIKTIKLDKQMNLYMNEDFNVLLKNYKLREEKLCADFLKEVTESKSTFENLSTEEKLREIKYFYQKIEKILYYYRKLVYSSRHNLRLSIKYRLFINTEYKTHSEQISQNEKLYIYSEIVKEAIEKQKITISNHKLQTPDDVSNSFKIYDDLNAEIEVLKKQIKTIYILSDFSVTLIQTKKLLNDQKIILFSFSKQIYTFINSMPVETIEEIYKKELEESIQNLRQNSRDLIQQALEIIGKKILDKDYYDIQISSVEIKSKYQLDKEINFFKEKLANSKAIMNELKIILKALYKIYRDEYIKMRNLNYYFWLQIIKSFEKRIKVIVDENQPLETKKFFTFFEHYHSFETEKFFDEMKNRNIDKANNYLRQIEKKRKK